MFAKQNISSNSLLQKTANCIELKGEFASHEYLNKHLISMVGWYTIFR